MHLVQAEIMRAPVVAARTSTKHWLRGIQACRRGPVFGTLIWWSDGRRNCTLKLAYNEMISRSAGRVETYSAKPKMVMVSGEAGSEKIWYISGRSRVEAFC